MLDIWTIFVLDFTTASLFSLLYSDPEWYESWGSFFYFFIFFFIVCFSFFFLLVKLLVQHLVIDQCILCIVFSGMRVGTIRHRFDVAGRKVWRHHQEHEHGITHCASAKLSLT